MMTTISFDNSEWWHPVLRWGVSGVVALWGAVSPSMPYIMLCTGFVALNFWSERALRRRVRSCASGGKVAVGNNGNMLCTLGEIYAVLLLAHFTQSCMPELLPVDLRQLVAGGVCGWQFWGYLENKASCNGARWARLARKILADKSSKYVNININEDGEKETEKD